MIYSLQVERHVLSGLLKHQDLFADIDVFLTENDFEQVKSCIQRGDDVNQVR